MSRDFAEFIEALLAAGARFLVVGAHALAVHGVIRATGDIDIWVDPTADDAQRVWQALLSFGAPASAMGVTLADLSAPDMVVRCLGRDALIATKRASGRHKDLGDLEALGGPRHLP